MPLTKLQRAKRLAVLRRRMRDIGINPPARKMARKIVRGKPKISGGGGGVIGGPAKPRFKPKHKKATKKSVTIKMAKAKLRKAGFVVKKKKPKNQLGSGHFGNPF